MQSNSADKTKEKPKRKVTRRRRKTPPGSTSPGESGTEQVTVGTTRRTTDSGGKTRAGGDPGIVVDASTPAGPPSASGRKRKTAQRRTKRAKATTARKGTEDTPESRKDANVLTTIEETKRTRKEDGREAEDRTDRTSHSSPKKPAPTKTRTRRRRSEPRRSRGRDASRDGTIGHQPDAAGEAAEARGVAPDGDRATPERAAAQTTAVQVEVRTLGAPSLEVEEADNRRSDEAPGRARRRRVRKDRRKTAPPQATPTDVESAPSEPESFPDVLLDEERGRHVADSTAERPDDASQEIFPEPDLRKPCTREMIINVTAGDECRIAILHEGRLEELFIERASAQSHVGNIYKGRVTNVETSIQAAFVDFGLPKNGFLHISDVQPQYFPTKPGEAEEVGRKIPRHLRPPIQKCFRRGQEVMVQITKEGVGTKGPTLSSYLSIPGRYLVMMPGMNRVGVSRKIEDDEARRKMKKVMNELSFPPGMGFILRTAGLDQTKRELQRDLNYMLRLWKRVVDRVKRLDAPAELYRESDLVTRTIRDVYTTDFDRLIVDDASAAKKAKDFFALAMPRSKPRIEVYTEPEPLFHRLRIEDEIERINARHVPLPSGGSLVIDSTEALVAIDVNSGRFRSPEDAEETAVRINVEAAEEIARQLLLRDLGGLIVCDFIDMRLDRNKRQVERALRDALKKHKERARLLRMSAFGLIEMTRQRQGPSLKRNIYFDCPHCHGSGLVKMPESVILDVMRTVQLAAYHPEVQQLRITVATDVGYQILNSKRSAISIIEQATGTKVAIRGDLSFTSDQVECICEDSRGQPITISGVPISNTPPWPAPTRKR